MSRSTRHKAQFTIKDRKRERLPPDAEARSQWRAVAGVVPRRRPPGAVPRDPNSPRTCPWSSFPPSLRLLDGSSPVENGVSRASCPPAFMTRLLNFPNTQSRTREIRSRGRYYRTQSLSKNPVTYPSHNDIGVIHRAAGAPPPGRRKRRRGDPRTYVTYAT